MTEMPAAFVQEAFKIAMRRCAKSVAVITCRLDGARYAMAATAVDSVSMEPASMLACVNRTASIFQPLAARVDFCINILGGHHEKVSNNCNGAIKGEERFLVGDWIEGEDGVPLLADAQASITCRFGTMLEYGTHGIFIGDVIAVRIADPVSPLIYVNGGYMATS